MVSLVKLCRWLGLPRRSLYYRPQSRQRVISDDLAARVKLTLERFPTYGYRRLACVLGENRKPIQRILQLKGWQVRKRPQGFRPRAKSLPSAASRPDERRATDLTHVWCGKNRRASLAVIIDRCTREILGWRLSDNGSSKAAEAALEEALIYRLGALERIQQPLALRSDNGLVFSSRHYTGTLKAYGLRQEFTMPYTPEQNGLVERFFRSLKEECIWLHRFESLGQARAVIDRWIRYYNEERPHQSLDYVGTPSPPPQYLRRVCRNQGGHYTERKEVLVGNSENAKRLRHTYATEAHAIEEATAELTRLQRKHSELTLDLAEGRADIYPETPVATVGYKPEIDATPWIIDEVRHDLNDRGYTCSIRMETLSSCAVHVKCQTIAMCNRVKHSKIHPFKPPYFIPSATLGGRP